MAQVPLRKKHIAARKGKIADSNYLARRQLRFGLFVLHDQCRDNSDDMLLLTARETCDILKLFVTYRPPAASLHRHSPAIVGLVEVSAGSGRGTSGWIYYLTLDEGIRIEGSSDIATVLIFSECERQ